MVRALLAVAVVLLAAAAAASGAAPDLNKAKHEPISAHLAAQHAAAAAGATSHGASGPGGTSGAGAVAGLAAGVKGPASGGCELFQSSKERCLGPKEFSSCHGGVRPCSCAWCDATARCVDYEPCHRNRSHEEALCPAGVLAHDPHWTCSAYQGYSLARHVNLVILCSAAWWLPGAIIARAMYHRLKRQMPSSVAAGLLWTLAGAGPFAVNALLVYRNESNWNVVVSGFFWWYAIFMGVPLLILFALEVWTVLTWRRLHPANKMVVLMLAAFVCVVASVLGHQVHHHADKNGWYTHPFRPAAASRRPPPGPGERPSAADWPLIYKATLLLQWLGMLQPLVKLRGDLVPLVSLAYVSLEGAFLLLAESHRGYSAELNWLGWAMYLAGLPLLWNAFDVLRNVRLGGFFRGDLPRVSTLALTGAALGSGLLAVLVPSVMPRATDIVEMSRYFLVVAANAVLVLPLVLPLFDRDDPWDGEAARAGEALERDRANERRYRDAVARKQNEFEEGTAGSALLSPAAGAAEPAADQAGASSGSSSTLRNRVSEIEAQLDSLDRDQLGDSLDQEPADEDEDEDEDEEEEEEDEEEDNDVAERAGLLRER